MNAAILWQLIQHLGFTEIYFKTYAALTLVAPEELVDTQQV